MHIPEDQVIAIDINGVCELFISATAIQRPLFPATLSAVTKASVTGELYGEEWIKPYHIGPAKTIYRLSEVKMFFQKHAWLYQRKETRGRPASGESL